ncbi:NADPH-dependent FMN reductase [Fredinandcohnia humi]
MNLLVISGGPNKSGNTRIVSRYLSQAYNIDLFDLSEIVLPLFNGEKEQDENKSVKLLRNAVDKTDGILLVTPEYHNAMSGALKNAIEFLGSKHFEHKPIGLIAVCGGGKGGINALNNMRTVARSLYANVLSRQLVIDPISIDRENKNLYDNVTSKINDLLDELFLYTKIHITYKERIS